MLHPWLAMAREAADVGLTAYGRVASGRDPVGGAVDARSEVERWTRERLEHAEPSPELAASTERLAEALRRSATRAETLGVELLGIAARAEAEVQGMDFRLLYDARAEALSHRIQRHAGSARRALLRPPGLGGAARELPRDREGRRPGVALVRRSAVR